MKRPVVFDVMLLRDQAIEHLHYLRLRAAVLQAATDAGIREDISSHCDNTSPRCRGEISIGSL